MTAGEIVAKLAESKTVERVISTVTHRPATHPDSKDLAQMIYEALLAYDEKILDECYSKGEIKKLIARITINQYYSATSPYYKLIKQLRERSNEIKTT